MRNVFGSSSCYTTVFTTETNLLRELNIEDSSGFRNFFRMTKSDFEILIQKIGPRIPRKDTKFREVIPPSIRLDLMLTYLAIGDFSLDFSYADFIFLQENQSLHLSYYGFCNLHNVQTIKTHWTANLQ